MSSTTQTVTAAREGAAEPAAMWSAPGAGERLWFLGTLAIVRVPGEGTGGRLAPAQLEQIFRRHEVITLGPPLEAQR